MTAARKLSRGLRPIVLALTAVVLLAAPATARELSAEEKAALVERIEEFDAAMADNDLETIIGIVPPTVFAILAEKAGVTDAQLREALIEQAGQAMEAVTVISFGMDLAAAEYEQLPDGMPYVRIQTETVLDAGAGEMKATTETLALIENGQWYLMRIDDEQQVEILKSVYPEFAGVEFQPGTMEAVE